MTPQQPNKTALQGWKVSRVSLQEYSRRRLRNDFIVLLITSWENSCCDKNGEFGYV